MRTHFKVSSKDNDFDSSLELQHFKNWSHGKLALSGIVESRRYLVIYPPSSVQDEENSWIVIAQNLMLDPAGETVINVWNHARIVERFSSINWSMTVNLYDPYESNLDIHMTCKSDETKVIEFLAKLKQWCEDERHCLDGEQKEEAAVAALRSFACQTDDKAIAEEVERLVNSTEGDRKQAFSKWRRSLNRSGPPFGEEEA